MNNVPLLELSDESLRVDDFDAFLNCCTAATDHVSIPRTNSDVR